MIQINLLPDVKQQLISARKTRNMVISFAIFAGLASGGLVLLLGLLLGVQAARNIDAENQIKSEYAKLSQVSDLSNLVTIQNQLANIDQLHDNKSIDSRLFSVLQAINPAEPNNVQFLSVTISPEENILEIEGTAAGGYPALEALEKTILNTKFEYTSADSEDNTVISEPLASSLSTPDKTFGESESGGRVLRFKMIVTYHEQLFKNTSKTAQVNAPTQKIDVTDSRIRIPESLFGTDIKKEETN